MEAPEGGTKLAGSAQGAPGTQAPQEQRQKPKRVNPHSKLIESLQGLVLEKKHEIKELKGERRRLLMRAEAAKCLGLQAECLAALAETILRPRKGAGGIDASDRGCCGVDPMSDGSTDSGSSGRMAANAHAAATAMSEAARLHTGMCEQLRGSGGANGDGRGAGCSGGVSGSDRSDGSGLNVGEQRGGQMLQPAGPELSVHWWPVPAEAAEGPHYSVSLEGFKSMLLESLRLIGCLLPRVRSGAADAGSCLSKLAVLKARLMRHYACLTIENPAVLGKVLLEPLEEGLHTSADAPEAPLSHWVHAVKQMGMSKEQEEMALLLLESRHSRQLQVAEVRQRLLSEISGTPDDTRLITELAAAQTSDVVTMTVFSLALYDSVLSVEQYCAFALAAWPWMPPLEGLRQAMRSIAEEKQAQ